MKILSIVLVLSVAGSLSAHDTWLEPVQFAASPRARVTLHLTSAAGFTGPESGAKPWRVRRAFCRIGDESFLLGVGEPGEKFLTLSGIPGRPGVAMFCVELKPRQLELESKHVDEYLDEIHAPESLRAQWLALPEPRRWRENYTKLTKTFVRVGTPPAGDRSWAEPAGLALEIVPEQDPTALHSSDEFSVRVLQSGAPLAGLSLGFVVEGETSQHIAVTDAAGRAKATLDHPGRWLIHGTYLRRSADPELEWESDFVTLVVNVTAKQSP